MQHDRNLVAAGRRSKGGRGRSAAKVTPQDGASLLIAVAGSNYVKDSVETLEQYGNKRIQDIEFEDFKYLEDEDFLLERNKHDGRSWLLPGLYLPHLRSLEQSHTFLEAMTAIIADELDGSLSTARNKVSDNPLPNSLRRFDPHTKQDIVFDQLRIEVKMISPNNDGEITFWTRRWKEKAVYRRPLGRDAHETAAIWSNIPSTHLNQIRWFWGTVLAEVGVCLSC